jgi:hypothetical protein
MNSGEDERPYDGRSTMETNWILISLALLAIWVGSFARVPSRTTWSLSASDITDEAAAASQEGGV